MSCPGFKPARPGDAVPVEHVRASEVNAVYLGIPLILLMENAGRSVVDLLECRLGGVKGKTVHILAGKGGNAGDGFVAARHLAERGARVYVHLSGRPEEVRHPDARVNLEILEHSRAARVLRPGSRGWLELGDADAVVDAMLGIGVRGSLRGAIRDMARAFNRAPGLRLAIDTPTGLDPDTGVAAEDTVRADVTLAMGWAKRGFFAPGAAYYTGEVLVASIGVPRAAEEEAGPGDLYARLPARPADAHKGVGGRVLVVAGSESFVGAALLAAGAASRVGVDLVFIASPRFIAYEAASRFSSVVPLAMESGGLSRRDVCRLLRLAGEGRFHAALVGPGLGSEEEVLDAAARLIGGLLELGVPTVIDADGIKAATRLEGPLQGAVLTPHRGEARRLGARGEGVEAARSIAGRIGGVVLLKGPVDYVCSPEGRCRANRSGVPAMSVGGTGDVLSGLLAGILARRTSKRLDPDLLNSAAAAAFLAGKAGELAYSRLGESMTAYDVLESVPRVLAWSAELARQGRPILLA